MMSFRLSLSLLSVLVLGILKGANGGGDEGEIKVDIKKNFVLNDGGM